MRVNGERDPVGFMSVLNMRQHQAAEPISQIREHVLAKCPKQGKVRSAFEKALTLAPAAKLQGGSLASATGLLLSERFFILPAQIAGLADLILRNQLVVVFSEIFSLYILSGNVFLKLYLGSNPPLFSD